MGLSERASAVALLFLGAVCLLGAIARTRR
jgi:hypothetical protein